MVLHHIPPLLHPCHCCLRQVHSAAGSGGVWWGQVALWWRPVNTVSSSCLHKTTGHTIIDPVFRDVQWGGGYMMNRWVRNLCCRHCLMLNLGGTAFAWSTCVNFNLKGKEKWLVPKCTTETVPPSVDCQLFSLLNLPYYAHPAISLRPCRGTFPHFGNHWFRWKIGLKNSCRFG